jgi:hypothetical protein
LQTVEEGIGVALAGSSFGGGGGFGAHWMFMVPHKPALVTQGLANTRT